MKTKRRIFLLILLIGLTLINSIISAEALKPVQNKQLVYSDTLPKSVDTSQYLGLPFWNSSLSKTGGQGYIDTFSVYNSKFRIIHNDTMFNGFVEKFTNRTWVKCFEIELGNHNGYELKDVNGDGYKDFLHSWKWFSDVYFFDPQKGNFIDTVAASVSLEWTLIDSTRKIYCDFNEGKQLCGNINSTLYTFHGFSRYNLYQLELYNCDGDQSNRITKLIVARCVNGNCDHLYNPDQAILKEPININDKRWIDSTGKSNYFDYTTYWKKKYKKLLGYR